ncbi:MAG: Gfo/Idh/MocA family oxidoreductase [Candidatus Humimicrobiaceae bacterium]
MSNKIKWGVLGYARIANDFVIPAIVKASNSEFYAIASRKPESLRECQEKFHCSKTYESYDLLLADPEVQAVYIPLHTLCKKAPGFSRGDESPPPFFKKYSLILKNT